MLCGEPLYIQHHALTEPRPHLEAPDEVLATATVATAGGVRAYQHLDSPDVFAFAKRMAAAFPAIPLLGCDAIKDVNSGELYDLEVNPN